MVTELTEGPRRAHREPTPHHPLLLGKAELARGSSSTVIDSGDGRSVYKVLRDPAAYFYYTDKDRPRGRHFPKVYEDFGIIARGRHGAPVYLIRMERLYPLPRLSDMWFTARHISIGYRSWIRAWAGFSASLYQFAFRAMVSNPLMGRSMDRSVESALRALADYADRIEAIPDLLDVNNMMMRKDGTLVFADPLFVPGAGGLPEAGMAGQ